MVMFKKISGHHRHVLSMAELPDAFVHSETPTEAVARNTIRADLDRTPLILDKHHYSDFISAWTEGGVNLDYSQGDMNAGQYACSLTCIFAYSDRFVKKNEAGRQEKDRENVNNSNLNGYKVTPSLSFAYFDDDGILCGFNLTCYSPVPSLWIAAIMRNTTGKPKKTLKNTIEEVTTVANKPEEIDVFFFCHEDVIAGAGDEKIQSQYVLKSIMGEINSKAIEALLAPMIRTNGAVNLDAMLELSKRIHVVYDIDFRDKKIEALNKELQLLKGSKTQSLEIKEKIDRLAKVIDNAQNDINYFYRATQKQSPPTYSWIRDLFSIISEFLISTVLFASFGDKLAHYVKDELDKPDFQFLKENYQNVLDLDPWNTVNDNQNIKPRINVSNELEKSRNKLSNSFFGTQNKLDPKTEPPINTSRKTSINF